VIRDWIAESQVRAEQLRLLVLKTAWQVHGAAGLSQDFPLAAAFARMRILRVADGPDEVHKHASSSGKRSREVSKRHVSRELRSVNRSPLAHDCPSIGAGPLRSGQSDRGLSAILSRESAADAPTRAQPCHTGMRMSISRPTHPADRLHQTAAAAPMGVDILRCCVAAEADQAGTTAR
jgi:hypothetical protein